MTAQAQTAKRELKRGDRSYEIEFLTSAELVRVARVNYTENFTDPDGFDEQYAEDHVYEWDELEHETREFSTLQETVDFIKREKLKYQIMITERRYVPGLYLNTDWEPQSIWKVFPTRVQSARDLHKPKLEAA